MATTKTSHAGKTPAKKFNYKTPQGYTRLRTLRGKSGIARILKRTLDQKIGAQFHFWKTNKSLFIWAASIDTQRLGVQNIFEAAAFCLKTGQAVPLIGTAPAAITLAVV